MGVTKMFNGWYIVGREENDVPKADRQPEVVEGDYIGATALNAWHIKHNVSKAEMYRRIGVSNTTYNKFFSAAGVRGILPINVMRLCEATGYELHPSIFLPQVFDADRQYRMEDGHPMRVYMARTRKKASYFIEKLGIEATTFQMMNAPSGQGWSRRLADKMEKLSGGELRAKDLLARKKYPF